MTTKLTTDRNAARTFCYEHAHAAGRQLHAETGVKFSMVRGRAMGTYLVGIESGNEVYWIAASERPATAEPNPVAAAGE